MSLIGRSLPLQAHLVVMCCLFLWQSAAHAEEGNTAPDLPAEAQVAVVELAERYAGNSITSIARADQALNEANSVRNLLRDQFAATERACYTKFFTNACIDNAKEQLRLGLAALRPIELEASTFKRQAKVDKRDLSLAEKQSRDEAEAMERLSLQQEKARQGSRRAEKLATGAAENVIGREAQEAGIDERVQRHAEKMRALQEEDALKETERQRNIAKYEEKVQQSEERQQKIAEKRALKQQQKENKAIRAQQ